MHLEEVNIEGVKSFSEKTNMGFQPGIGVIMGNNGVGKSNILDAIVWAMGEDDILRLRCYEEEELFFSGSKKYPPAEKIQVELIFKENSGKESPVIKLSRELSRDGRSRFRMGDEPCSRSDFSKKLTSLRIEHSLKTIIRQEEINDLIQLPPQERFSAIQALLEVQTEADLGRHIREKVAPIFQRYMSYLMPLAEVQLEVTSQNGKRGIDVEVTLSGNRIRRAHQLSGGEKAITSLALKLAVFHLFDSQFYLLDEVEPSLDYTNHKSMQAFLKDVAADKQLIMITHLRSTIDLADTVHGVRTRFDGSSFMKFYFLMDERLLRLYKCC
ncbi:MAG: AAA family ATPase [Deltaproteobacteria bacterium]|nr:AAA family ATPase [Deltaproteobacteria bacterium]